jgi:hypothetical protein
MKSANPSWPVTVSEVAASALGQPEIGDARVIVLVDQDVGWL